MSTDSRLFSDLTAPAGDTGFCGKADFSSVVHIGTAAVRSLTNTRRALIALSLTVICSCSKAPDGPILEAAIDSAGSGVPVDTIQTTNAPLFIADPYVEIGGESDDARFSRIMGLEYHSGEVYVVDQLSNNVRVFDQTGHIVRKFGGRGGGPGETVFPRQILFSHDTVFVMDQAMIHRFRPDGSFIARTGYLINQNIAKWGAVSLVPQDFAMAPQGLVGTVNFSVASRAMSGESKPAPDTISLFLMSPDSGTIQKRFLRIGSNDFYAYISSGHSLAHFAPASEFVVTSDGRVLVNARDGSAIDEYRDGVKTRRVVLRAEKRLVTDADVDSAIAHSQQLLIALLKNENFSAPKNHVSKTREGLRHLARQHYFPSTGKLIASDDGSVLMMRPDLSDGMLRYRRVYGATTWDIISRDLRIIGRVEFPDGFYPMLMRAGVVIGQTTDEDDVPTVVGYKLVPQPGETM